MDVYEFSKLLNFLGNAIKNALMKPDDALDYLEDVSDLPKDQLSVLLRATDTEASDDALAYNVIRAFNPEITTNVNPNLPTVQGYLADFKAGIRGEPRPSDAVEVVEETATGGAAGMPGGTGGAVAGSQIISGDVQALSAEAIDSTLRNAVQMGQIPGANTILEDGTLGVRQFDEAGDEVPPISYTMDEETIIQTLIAVAPDIKFLGFANRGYPLGYKDRDAGEGYGDFPVYLPDMSDSLFGRSGIHESYIGDLQEKLIRAGYLRSSFQPEVFDDATKLAVEEAMATHNREGRVPPIPEVAGSLLDFLGLGEVETKYAWDSQRNQEVQDFLFNELDKDVATANERRFSDVLTEIPKFQDETAGYLMLNTLQQYFPGGGITLDNIKNATTLVNKVSANVAQDLKKMQREAEEASIASGVAAIDAAGEITKLRERNPGLSDKELQLMYPELFDRKATVVGELGAFGEGAAERQSILFQQRLGTAVQNLIQPEIDFLEKQNQFNRATGNFLAASRGLNALEQGAPT